MGSRSRFRPRFGCGEPRSDPGTKGERPGGMAVQPSRGGVILVETGVREDGATQPRVFWSRQARKAPWGVPEVSVPETDTGGRGEQPQVNE
jgi:hypothetical protein